LNKSRIFTAILNFHRKKKFMAESKVIRLTKAAREFNIGRETIVYFLENKGFKIDVNPNTKLTPEMVDLLTREFSVEKSVKEEARKKGIISMKKETISLEDRKRPVQDLDDGDEEDDIIIRNVSVEVTEEFKRAVESHTEIKSQPKPEAEKPAPTPEKVASPKVEKTELPKSKPVEKPLKDESIDVAKSEEKSEKPEKEEQTPTATKEIAEPDKVIEPIKVEDAKSDVSEPAKGEKKASPKEQEPEKPVVETKLEAPKEEALVAKSEDADRTVKKIEKETEAVVMDKPKAEVKQKPESAKTVKEGPTASEKPKEETVVTKETAEPRIIGKIDLSTINERTKPKPKTSAQKRKEQEEKRKAARRKPEQYGKTLHKPPVAKAQENIAPDAKTEKSDVPVPKPKEQASAATAPQSNFLEMKVERLAGVNIVGKIDLPEKKKPTKKKPVASSTDDKISQKRKKRKRIKKDEKAPAQQQPQQRNHQQAAGQRKRPVDNKGKVRPTKGKKHHATPELTEEEVQKQIKETLARLSGAGKSKASKHRRAKRDHVSKVAEQEAADRAEENKNITVAEFVTANELSTMMDKPVTDIISVCMQLGLFVSINQRLDAETINLVAEEFGFGVNFESAESAIDQEDEEEDKPEDLKPRSPIVTVMGHVDHGKTKLLDYIRSANVVAGEAGGITQHIGAYEVEIENGKKITFLDTPGHEAFTAMRARGAKVTDVAIIVVAADDSVMPQTVEAINHAQAANVPIVFAINKIDRPTANPERIKDQLSQMNILVEDWGGKYQSQEISAKEGLNIDELLEKVLLESELLDLKANPSRLAHGTVIESSLDKGRGYVSTLLVQNGTLKIGDLVLAGSHYGRVKAMYNERNQAVKEAGPSAPLLMLGMNGAPQAGDLFKAMKDEREAKNIAAKRQQLQREQGLRTQKHITLDEIGRRIAIGDFQELNVIVKGDVDGSVEALSDSLIKLGNEEIQVNVIHKSVGPVTETDVMLASASNAIIVAFQVRPSLGARRIAEKEQIDIRTYSIIYSAIEEIKAAIEGMLSPDIQEKITCNIEVREVFKITKVGTIAGCLVLDGNVKRSTRVRIIRDGIVVYTGKLGSLKRFKDDVKEVQSGYECGLNIENFNDIKVGDIVEGFEEIKVARKLD